MVVVVYRRRRRDLCAPDLRLDVVVLRCHGDAELGCLGEHVGAATGSLWTFASPSWPRRGGVLSSAVGMKEMGVLELLLLAFWGWRRAGVFGGLYWVCGPMVAVLVLLLAVGDRSCGIW